MMSKQILGGWLAIAALVAMAPQSLPQTSAAPVDTLEFDVASVRQNNSGPPPEGDAQQSNVPLGPGDIYTPTGGVFTAHNFPLQTYILFAYRMTDGQWKSFRAQLPDWALTERFNIEARTEKHDVTKNELRMMMRALLAERFKFALHTEARTTSVFGLVLVKSDALGPRLRLHPARESCSKEFPKPDAPHAEVPPSDTVPGGFPIICGGILRMDMGGSGSITLGGRAVAMRLLADAAAGWGQLNRPVIDLTGLKGDYDFVLQFAPLPPPDAPSEDTTAGDSGTTFQSALKQQLGLRLQPEKVPIDFLVLDHIEHAAEN